MSAALPIEILKLSNHIFDIARTFDIDLYLSDKLAREVAVSFHHPKTGRKSVYGRPVTDETSYVILMHELGHHLAPSGHLLWEPQYLHLTVPKTLEQIQQMKNLQLDSEYAAWEWAEANVLYWSAAMESVKQFALGDYEGRRTR